jgi:ABC-type taurine transport system ATPase subunit
MPKNLLLESVSKVYGRLYAVRNVSLEIGEGEFVTLLGPSGCGKTTTLRMIAGFEAPTSGRIFYDGREISGLIPQKRRFGIVFQSYALFPHMKVSENVAFGQRMRRYPKGKIGRRVALARAMALISLFGANGIVTAGLLKAEWNIYGAAGIVVSEVLFCLPRAMVILYATLSAVDTRLDEAAAGLGASGFATFFRITVPTARYGLFSAAALTFNLTITDFGNPIIIGRG